MLVDEVDRANEEELAQPNSIDELRTRLEQISATPADGDRSVAQVRYYFINLPQYFVDGEVSPGIWAF